jgi:hypothetical protein
MKGKIIIILVLIAVILSPVMAVNMSITNFGTAKQDIQIYTPNGTMIGLYNTSSPIIPLPDTDFQIVIRPNTAASYISNPGLFLTDAVGYLMTFAIPLFVILGFCAILIGLSRYGRR